MFYSFLLFFSFLLLIISKNEEAIIVYSRDNNCKGQEMIRAFTKECKEYYSNDNSIKDYFQFECNKNNNMLILKQFSDNNCKEVKNITILFQSSSSSSGSSSTTISNTNGMCNILGDENSNYHSAQLFCDGISSIDNPKTFFNAFETEKIMFKHFTNSDNTCSNKPSVVELVTYIHIHIYIY